MKTINKLLCAIILFLSHSVLHAQIVSSPKSHFGFSIGDDYKLANYKQIESYFLKVAQESDRVLIQEAGVTEEGRKQYLLIVSSPENLAQIEKYRTISQKLGRAEGLTDSEAKKLAKEGKPIVWIDGGMHSNEMVGSHQLIETFYLLASSRSEEVEEFLDKTIVLMWHVNPDGQDLMADWYMQYDDVHDRNMSIPRLYHKYVGHDNNRDFFMFTMKESSNLAKVMYIDWLPQIVYNHHQPAPTGTVLAGPPYRDPFNYVFDPLLVSGIDGVGFAMINRLNEEGKPGYARMDQSTYSTWWNGGLRTAPYFHNMIGILTEITGNPTPSEIKLVPEKLIPRNGLPYPIAPQKWNFKKSIDYSVSLNFAILDYAARNGDKLLYNFYKMGQNSIHKGSTDHWTASTKRAAEMIDAYKKDMEAKNGKPFLESKSRYSVIPSVYYDSVFRSPENKDPRVYVIPSDQDDFGTAIKFVNALIKSGVYVYQATADMEVDGHVYPKNSLVIKTNQAFRPQIIDMFEAQDHPHDTQYEGGPPIRPYDAAGWTLAMQMGVKFARFYTDIEGPLQRLPYGELITIDRKSIENNSKGYFISAKANDSFLVINRLQRQGAKVYRDEASNNFYVDNTWKNHLEKAIEGVEISIELATRKPSKLTLMKPLKIGLFDYYGGSMPSGWTRWILEQYGFDYTLFYPKDIDSQKILQYDILLFIGSGIPSRNDVETSFRQPKGELVPQQFEYMLGQVSKKNSLPILRQFIEDGGRILTVGASSELAYHFNLSVTDPLVKLGANGNTKKISSNDYYIPTSILEAQLATNLTEIIGMESRVNVVFNNSPIFKLSNTKTLYSLGSFDLDTPLLSGWAHGQQYIKDASIGFVALLGKGKLISFGPEITNRAQSHGTFKLLFNQLYN